MVTIYVLYIRSICEQSSTVWHSSLTQENIEDLERVQKVASKIILKDQYESYDSALKKLGLEKLSDRRQCLSLNFARKCTKHEIAQKMFPKKDQAAFYSTRTRETYEVSSWNTDRLKRSAILYMQDLLNKYA